MATRCSNNSIRVLVTAIGGPNGYGVVKCLNSVDNIVTYGVDSDRCCPTQRFVDDFYVVPRIDNSSYVHELFELVRQKGIDFIIPTLHDEIPLIPKLRKLGNVVAPRMSGEELNSLLDKTVVYKKLTESGYGNLVPRHFRVHNMSELFAVAQELGYPQHLVCVKHSISHGSMGFMVLASTQHVARAWAKRNIGTWCTLEQFADVYPDMQCTNTSLFAMEYLSGPEYSVDLLADHGRVLVGVPRTRDRVANGIVISGATENNRMILDATTMIACSLGLDCFANLQFRLDATAKPVLLDLNPRFCGSQVMSFGAGVNYPLLAIQLMQGTNLSILEPKWGMRTVRYWESEFFEERV